MLGYVESWRVVEDYNGGHGEEGKGEIEKGDELGERGGEK